MRILLLTQFFQPELQIKGLPFAHELQRRGHEVVVLTGFPNYPGGRVYEGYAVRPLQREVLEGVPVVRVPLYPSHDRSAVRRSLNYLSFGLAAAALGPALVPPVDVVYAYHPPLTVGLAASAFSVLRKVPFVYDIQDLWPDTVATTGMLSGRFALCLLHRACNVVYRRAARIAVLSPGFKRKLVERGVPAEKIEVIYNWTDEDSNCSRPPDPVLAADLGLAGRFNVVFAGTMGRAQALDAVLEAAQRLADLADVQLVLLGGGIEAERLRQRARELRLGNVRFLEHRPAAQAGAVLDLADVLLVHLKDDPLFRITIPSKTQAYLAKGKPIVMAVHGDAADLVSRAGAGVLCAPEDPSSIAEAVRRLYKTPRAEREAMGQAGKAFYEQELSLRRGADRFVGLFEAAAATCAGSSARRMA